MKVSVQFPCYTFNERIFVEDFEEVFDSPVKIPRVASTISFTATSLLPMLSLLTSLPFVRLNADGIIDWVKYAPRINFDMKN